MFGFTGSILFVDLKLKKFWLEHPGLEFYRRYWGGRNIGLYYLFRETLPKIDPLSPDNIIVFTAGFAAGTNIPGFSRYTVCAKSPLTGFEGESEAGGYWGTELKKAGYDAIVITSVSVEPVYLWINNEKVEFKDAKNIWGKDTGTTQEIIKSDLGDKKIKIAQIGIAGENLVRFAGIVNELKHFNGRNGLGAVMGSKKLKAIAVKGTKKLPVYDKDRLYKIIKKMNKQALEEPMALNFKKYGTVRGVRAFYETGCLPTKNWSTGYFPNGENLTAEIYNRDIFKKNEGCYACPIRCKRVVKEKVRDINLDPQYGGPEYETVVSLGSLCGIDDLVYIAKANELCNKYTLDTISTGSVIAFAMNCFEEGIISEKDTGGLRLNFGNKKAVLKLITQIAEKKGFGKILSEGTLRASKLIQNKSELFLRQVKGQEVPMHDPRVKTGLALQYALSGYGADHLKALHDPAFADNESWGIRAMESLGVYKGIDPLGLGQEKVKLFKVLDIYWSLLNILGVCLFFFGPATNVGTLNDLIEIIFTVTSFKTSWYELMQVGERSIDFARMYNLREGFNSELDNLPHIFFTDFPEGPLANKRGINREEFESAVQFRYSLMGWSKNGIPSKEKLIELDLDWLTKNNFM